MGLASWVAAMTGGVFISTCGSVIYNAESEEVWEKEVI
jgi:hypothetical protein